MIRVAIADDHALFRQGLISMLKLQPQVTVVAELARADDLAASLAQSPCDILLLDLQMDRATFSDIEALSERVAVLVVTATERAEDAVAALHAGARGVVFKRFAIETLMVAIDAVMDGHVWLPPALQAEITARLREPAAEGPLTRREREIVRHVALGLRNAEVADRLGVTEGTIKTHLNNIFQKLGLRDRVGLALYAVRTGLIGVNDGRRVAARRD
ncbi:MAG: response regulator transcription factor [Deltaproteobacteria bacterium]|nr:response regulator transcription factor [Deltaproteobacteria bacterium]